MKTISIAALMVGLVPSPTMACHRFHTWNYPWAQKCSVWQSHTEHFEPRNWYVEIQLPESQPEHDKTVISYKDEINRAINLLHTQEKYIGNSHEIQ